MNGRKPTVEEKQWLDAVAQLPCIVCEMFHDVDDTPAEIHHLSGQRCYEAHLKSIPLCTKHHRIKDNQHPSRWISFHGDGRGMFEGRYCKMGKLLDITQAQVELLHNMVV